MDPIRIVKKGNVAIVSLDRPHRLNAITTELLISLKRKLFLLNRDPKVRAIIITGSGKSFSSGADIHEISNFSFKEAYEFSQLGQQVCWMIEMSEKLTIAALRGYALGGGLEMALVADLRICHAGAKVGFPESKVGLIPCFGGTQTLQEVIGPQSAKNLIEKGMIIDAKDAHKLGLVDIVTKDDPVDAAIKLLKTLKTKEAVDAKSCSRRSTRRSPHLPRNFIDERSRFAGRFELQRTRLLLRKFIAEKKRQ